MSVSSAFRLIKHRSPRARRSVTDDSPRRTFLRAVCRAALFGLSAAVLLLFLFAAAGLYLPDPASAVPFFAAAAAFLSSLLCGITAALMTRSRGLVSGAAAGVLYALLLLLLQMLLPDSEAAADRRELLFLLCPLFSAVGGYIVTHHRPRQKKPQKHR